MGMGMPLMMGGLGGLGAGMMVSVDFESRGFDSFSLSKSWS